MFSRKLINIIEEGILPYKRLVAHNGVKVNFDSPTWKIECFHTMVQPLRNYVRNKYGVYSLISNDDVKLLYINVRENQLWYVKDNEEYISESMIINNCFDGSDFTVIKLCDYYDSESFERFIESRIKNIDDFINKKE